MGMSSSYIRAPATQEALKGKLRPSREGTEHIYHDTPHMKGYFVEHISGIDDL
jgi:hypothetical protein